MPWAKVLCCVDFQLGSVEPLVCDSSGLLSGLGSQEVYSGMCGLLGGAKVSYQECDLEAAGLILNNWCTPRSCTLHPKPSTLNPSPSKTLNPQPSKTPKPQNSKTLDPQLSTCFPGQRPVKPPPPSFPPNLSDTLSQAHSLVPSFSDIFSLEGT